MNPKTILAFLFFLTIQGASQDVPKPQTEAQCKFSDGKKITVTYSPQLRNYRLVTDGELVTVKGVTVPAGDYTAIRRWQSPDFWDLVLWKRLHASQHADLPPLPMSVAMATLPVGNFGISFDQTGGGCTLHWASEKTNTLLSLEFTEKNTDLPVLP